VYYNTTTNTSTITTTTDRGTMQGPADNVQMSDRTPAFTYDYYYYYYYYWLCHDAVPCVWCPDIWRDTSIHRSVTWA